MHREGQVTQLVARKKQMVVGLLDQLCQQVEITDTQFQTAKTRYEAVGAWLSASSSQHLDQVQIYPQGSIALGTAIKPLAANEFDVDLVVIDYVVAMLRIIRGLQRRRGVDVADAELDQVIGELRHFFEPEARPQLDPVRRPRQNHDSNL